MKLKAVVKSILNVIAPGLLDLRCENSLKTAYKHHMGKELNIKDPKTYTEKLQWYKMYYTTDEMRRCVDKYHFKQYIDEKLGSGYVAKLLDVWNSPEEVSINKIPYEKFVIKSNLQSDGKYIVLVKNKNEIDIDTIEKEIKENWFNPKNLLTNSFCRAYHGAKPRVIVEEFVEEFEGGADDYKVFCFDGDPKFFYCAEEHFENGITTKTHPISFYSLDWKVMDVQYGEHEINRNIPQPKHINEMIEISKKLSKGFPHVRVDFFDTEDKLYLAELTFYPGGGFTPYHPEEFDKEMGDMFILPKE